MKMTSKNHGKQLQTLAPGPGDTRKSGSKVNKSARSKNSTACLPCKQAKRKCTGMPAPCQACKTAQSECVFDETLDRRRKLNTRRTMDEMEHCRGLLYSLLESIRSSEPSRVYEVVNMIRSTDPLTKAASTIAETTVNFRDISLVKAPSPPTAKEVALHHGALQRQVDPQSRITLEKLCDVPLLQISTNPWTNVTEDSGLVSHLTSLYFTWIHPLLLLVDQRLILDHLATGRPNPDFCTPFLINSLLAVASFYSDYPEVFAVPGDTTSRGRLFYLNAERLWRSEEGKATLPNIQGVIHLAYYLKCQGKTRASWLMLRQGVQLAQDFGLFQGPKMIRPMWTNIPADLQHIPMITAWSVFILNSQMSMELETVANLEFPHCRPYVKDSLDDHTWWIPYPLSNRMDCAKKPGLLRYMIVELASLAEITVDVQGLLFDKALNMSLRDIWIGADKLYSRLKTWLESLPDILKVDDKPLPQALFLHIKCHQMLIALFAPFSNHEDYEQARICQLHSAQAITHYILIQRQCYGSKYSPLQFLEAMNSSLQILFRELGDAGCKDAFVELCRELVALSERFKSARVMIDDLRLVADESNVELPPESVVVLDGLEAESSPEP